MNPKFKNKKFVPFALNNFRIIKNINIQQLNKNIQFVKYVGIHQSFFILVKRVHKY